MKYFPFILQLDSRDCGPTCLRMIAKHYGKSYTSQTLRKRSYITREEVSLLGISDAAESIGFRTIGVKVGLEKLVKENVTPFIAHGFFDTKITANLVQHIGDHQRIESIFLSSGY